MDKNTYIRKANKLTLKQKKELILAAKAVCFEWWVDILDCSKSWYRQKTDMSFEDIMKKFDKTCHFIVIHRNFGRENHIEVGFCTMGKGPDYFLWINVTMEHESLFAHLKENGST